MKTILYSALSIVILFSSCNKKGLNTFPVSELTIDTLLKTTPVKEQGNSSLCWLYAMLATIETDRLMQGDSVNLSPHYLARHFLAEQAPTVYLTQGKKRYTLRGVAMMTLRLINKYGILNYNAYNTKTSYSTLFKKTAYITKLNISQKYGLDNLYSQLQSLFDTEISPLPKTQYLYGASYSPQQFARSIVKPNTYRAYTSVKHHPCYKGYTLEVADNYYRDTVCNIPLDSMVYSVKDAILSGKAVCWEGAISETAQDGFLLLDKPRDRQRSLENFSTTDDHCMAIVGLAHDNKGQSYFICKNSWGKTSGIKGFVYMSEEYFRARTILVIKS